MKNKINKKKKIIDEYKDLSKNMRHYGNIEFAAITVLVTITTGLLIAFFTFDSSQSNLIHCIRFILIPIAGMFTAIVFGVILRSAIYVWDLLFNRAVKLEESEENDLEYKQYSNIKNSKFFEYRPTKQLSMLFCCGIFFFWAFVMFIKIIEICLNFY